MRQETYPLGTISSNQVGQYDGGDQILPAAHRRFKTVQVAGTFTGTVTIEGSLDGSTYFTIASRSSPGVEVLHQAGVELSLEYVRVSGSSWSSGSAVATFSSFNSRTE